MKSIGTNLGALWLVFVPLATNAADANEEKLAIVGGALVHPERPGAPVDRDSTLIVSGERIQAVGPSKSTPVPKGARVIDAKGKWILPGLIDSHVHFFQSGNPYTRPDMPIDARKVVPYAKELERTKARLPATFKVWLASGVTSVADVGGPLWNFEVRAAARKSSAAPRVIVAGPVVSMADRPQLDLGDPPIVKITSAEGARAFVKKLLERKPDLIKVLFVRTPGDNLATLEPIVKAAGDTAHAAGVRLAVHATELDTAKAALRSGADLLVHSVMDAAVDPEFLSMAKARNALYIPTLFALDGYALVQHNSWRPTEPERRLADPQILQHMNDLEKVPKNLLPPRMLSVVQFQITYRPGVKTFAMENLRPVWDAGITVAMGTDAGNIGTLHGPSIFREMELMVKSGLSMPEVLTSATVNGAKVMGMERDLGSLAPGKLADLVILDANPLDSVHNLSRAHRVVKGGKVFDPTELIRSIQ